MMKVLLSIIGGIIILLLIISIQYNETTPRIDTKTDTKINKSIVPTYFSESTWDLKSLSKHAEYIVIGKVLQYNTSKYVINKDIYEPHATVLIEIEEELTGNYNNTIISYRSMDYGWIDEGDKALVFLAEKDPDSIWGDNYYLMGGPNGLYKIIDDKVYGQDLRDGLALDKVIDSIKRYRSERLKEVIEESRYIIIGNVSNIERLSDENQFAIITAIVEDDLLNNYNEKKIQFFTYDVRRWDGSWGEDSIGKRYLLFIKWDEAKGNFITPYNKYKIIDNSVYGPEFYEGIALDEVKSKIIQYKALP